MCHGVGAVVSRPRPRILGFPVVMVESRAPPMPYIKTPRYHTSQLSVDDSGPVWGWEMLTSSGAWERHVELSRSPVSGSLLCPNQQSFARDKHVGFGGCTPIQMPQTPPRAWDVIGFHTTTMHARHLHPRSLSQLLAFTPHFRDPFERSQLLFPFLFLYAVRSRLRDLPFPLHRSLAQCLLRPDTVGRFPAL